MKTINHFILAGTVSPLTLFQTQAQMKEKATQLNNHELTVLNQLGSPAVVVNMPVSQLLNAPGNEALRSFFFTSVKDSTILKGKKIAVIAADGFEEIELLGPVWYFQTTRCKS